MNTVSLFNGAVTIGATPNGFSFALGSSPSVAHSWTFSNWNLCMSPGSGGLPVTATAGKIPVGFWIFYSFGGVPYINMGTDPQLSDIGTLAPEMTLWLNKYCPLHSPLGDQRFNGAIFNVFPVPSLPPSTGGGGGNGNNSNSSFVGGYSTSPDSGDFGAMGYNGGSSTNTGSVASGSIGSSGLSAPVKLGIVAIILYFIFR